MAGIYSTKPGMLGTTRKIEESAQSDEIPLAVVGIVPCKITTENGPIQAGDLLVTASTPGHAMKGTDRTRMLGAVVGKALEPLARGTGVIQVLVTLQRARGARVLWAAFANGGDSVAPIENFEVSAHAVFMLEAPSIVLSEPTF